MFNIIIRKTYVVRYSIDYSIFILLLVVDISINYLYYNKYIKANIEQKNEYLTTDIFFNLLKQS